MIYDISTIDPTVNLLWNQLSYHQSPCLVKSMKKTTIFPSEITIFRSTFFGALRKLPRGTPGRHGWVFRAWPTTPCRAWIARRHPCSPRWVLRRWWGGWDVGCGRCIDSHGKWSIYRFIAFIDSLPIYRRFTLRRYGILMYPLVMTVTCYIAYRNGWP